MKILFATDGSTCSDEAAAFLAGMRFRPEDEILVFHVVSDIPYDDDYHARVKRLIRKVAPKIISSAMQKLQPLQVALRPVVIEGYPDEAIVAAAQDNGADLIVMGARGVKGLKLFVLGSATRAVVITSPVPVLVVKKPVPEQGIRTILYATDGSDCAVAAGQLLAELPISESTAMIVLAVIPSALSEVPEQYLAELEEPDRPAGFPDASPGDRPFESARKILEPKFRVVEYLTRTGNPSMEILAAAAETGADLIVVGSRGIRGIKGMIGSVSRNILAYAHCPVLIGKA